ncbi:hypothetical protein L1987_81897 [Smallanthus sonchifolius]|uniref:Uncharacterized protein n=1 Tax=Smallanthus sonchifolius TaxID=185202 RepID=A0ACB8YRP6_9ASTR|nr:hypothetical protein L1987_81897 [Smallanthus sonchifolius]
MASSSEGFGAGAGVLGFGAGAGVLGFGAGSGVLGFGAGVLGFGAGWALVLVSWALALESWALESVPESWTSVLVPNLISSYPRALWWWRQACKYGVGWCLHAGKLEELLLGFNCLLNLCSRVGSTLTSQLLR